MNANLITKKCEKTFKFYFFTTENYENNITLSVENEIVLFENEVVEMQGYTSGITQENETALYYSMNCSVNLIEEIKENDCIIVTSFYH